jgi:hypothetical protein
MILRRLFEKFQISRVMPWQFSVFSDSKVLRDGDNADNCHI